MTRKLLFLALLIFSLKSFAQTAEQGTWVTVNNGTCKYHYPLNTANGKAEWDGSCENNLVTGFGTLKFYLSDALQYTYVGEMLQGKEHGNGVFTQNNGSKVTGNFIDGIINGIATAVYSNGDRYEGYMKDMIMNGEGTYYTAAGNVYKGVFKNGEVTGHFTISLSNGIEYVGQVKKGAFHGAGTLTMQNKTSYKGTFVDDAPTGQFTITIPGGNKYVGSISEWQPSGQGTYTFSSGETYTGGWKNGVFHGKGTYTGLDGYKYTGDFVEGTRSGTGTAVYPDKTKYVGQWLDDERHGQGTLTSVMSQEKFIGEWQHDKPTKGYGIETDASGKITYQGDYDNTFAKPKNLETMNVRLMDCDGIYEGSTYFYRPLNRKVMLGKGKLTFTSGQYSGNVYEGEFHFDSFKKGPFTITSKEGNKLISNLVNNDPYASGFYFFKIKEQGEIIYKDGAVYKGEIQYLLPTGKGEMKYMNGTVITGTFSLGTPVEGILILTDGTRYSGKIKIESSGTMFIGSMYSNDRNTGMHNTPYNGYVFFADGNIVRMVEGKLQY